MNDLIAAVGIASAVALAFYGHVRRVYRNDVGINERMKRLGTYDPERDPVILARSAEQARAADEALPPRCPECGTRFGLHDVDCEYWRRLHGNKCANCGGSGKMSISVQVMRAEPGRQATGPYQIKEFSTCFACNGAGVIDHDGREPETERARRLR